MIIRWRENGEKVMEWKRQNVCFPSRIYTDWAVWGEKSRGHLLVWNRVSIYSSYAKLLQHKYNRLFFQNSERGASWSLIFFFLFCALSLSSSFLPLTDIDTTVMLLCCLVYSLLLLEYMEPDAMFQQHHLSPLTWATIVSLLLCHATTCMIFTNSMPTYIALCFSFFTQLHFLYHFLSNTLYVNVCKFLPTYFFVLYRKLSFFLSILYLSLLTLHFASLSPHVLPFSLEAYWLWKVETTADVMLLLPLLPSKTMGILFSSKRRKHSCVVWQSSTFEETAGLDEWMERDAASSSVCRSLTLTVSPTIYLCISLDTYVLIFTQRTYQYNRIDI